jgi:hypothetical protein
MTRNALRRRHTAPISFIAAVWFVLFETSFWLSATSIKTTGMTTLRALGFLVSILCFTLFVESTAFVVAAKMRGSQ